MYLNTQSIFDSLPSVWPLGGCLCDPREEASVKGCEGEKSGGVGEGDGDEKSTQGDKVTCGCSERGKVGEGGGGGSH